MGNSPACSFVYVYKNRRVLAGAAAMNDRA